MIIFLWKGLPAFLSLLSFSTIAMYALMKKLYAAKFAAVFYRVKLNLYIYIYIYIYTWATAFAKSEHLSDCLCKVGVLSPNEYHTWAKCYHSRVVSYRKNNIATEKQRNYTSKKITPNCMPGSHIQAIYWIYKLSHGKPLQQLYHPLHTRTSSW